MVSGLALQTEKPFEVGDWVEIQANRKENHVVAEVIQVNWRTTRLKSTSNNIIVIPNRRFCELTLTNFRAQDPVCRTEIELTFPLDECMDRVSDMLLLAVKETLDGVKLLESPEPEIRLGNRTLAGQSVEIRFYFSSLHISPDSARNVVMHSLLKALRFKSLQYCLRNLAQHICFCCLISRLYNPFDIPFNMFIFMSCLIYSKLVAGL